LRLVVEIVPPGDTCRNSGLQDTWRLAVHVPRQAVWKRVSPGGLGAAPSDNAENENHNNNKMNKEIISF